MLHRSRALTTIRITGERANTAPFATAATARTGYWGWIWLIFVPCSVRSAIRPFSLNGKA
jgi:hypothetical protein